MLKSNGPLTTKSTLLKLIYKLFYWPVFMTGMTLVVLSKNQLMNVQRVFRQLKNALHRVTDSSWDAARVYLGSVEPS